MKKLTSVILAAMLIMTGCGAANASRTSLSSPKAEIYHSDDSIIDVSDDVDNAVTAPTDECTAPSESIDIPADTVDMDMENAGEDIETDGDTETGVDTDIAADDTLTAEKEMPEADAAIPQPESKPADAVSSDTPSEAVEKTTPAAEKKDDANVIKTSAETKVGVVNSAPASKENNKGESKGTAAAEAKKEEAPAAKASDSKNENTSVVDKVEPAKSVDDVPVNNTATESVNDVDDSDEEEYYPVGIILGVYDPIIMIPEEDPIETGEAPTAPETEPNTDEEVKYCPGVNVGVYDPIVLIPDDESDDFEVDPNCTVPGPSFETIPAPDSSDETTENVAVGLVGGKVTINLVDIPEPDLNFVIIPDPSLKTEPAPETEPTPDSNESPKGYVGGRVTYWKTHIPLP